MAKRFDLLVFDWDGTLLDSAAAIAAAIQAACRDLNYPVPSGEEARHVIGLGLAEALRVCVPSLTDDHLPELIDCYRRHYFLDDHSLGLFEGVSELLLELHASQVKMAVATGKSRRGLERSLENCGLSQVFSASRCGDECFSKPHPQMLDELMAELAVEPERVLMIGDTTHDMQMAANAGVAAFAVTYGAHPSQALQALNPLFLATSVPEMRQWLTACA